MHMYLFSTEEYLGHVDRTPIAQQSSTVASNSIAITLAAAANKKHYIFHVMLTGTTGAGGSPTLTIAKGATTVWTEAFTVGTDLDRPFYCGLVGSENGAVTITAAATALTAGTLSVVGYTKG
jgi:hypothetical protein